MANAAQIACSVFAYKEQQGLLCIGKGSTEHSNIMMMAIVLGHVKEGKEDQNTLINNRGGATTVWQTH